MNNFSVYLCITCLAVFLLGGCTPKKISNQDQTSKPDIEIVKRSPVSNKNLAYNKYPTCIKGWEKHVSENIVFPETSNTNYAQGYVPILFRVRSDSTIYDIAINEAPRHKWRGTLITEANYQKEAIRLLVSSGQWLPFRSNGEYVDREGSVNVFFYYHEKYFEQSEEALVLNPDTKAKFIGQQRFYERLVKNKFGCDGVVEIIFIIEKDGTVSNVECLHAMGKTNCTIGLGEFSKLVPWESGMNDGKKVRTQMMFSIHI